MLPDPIREQPAPIKPIPPPNPAGDPKAVVAPTTAATPAAEAAQPERNRQSDQKSKDGQA